MPTCENCGTDCAPRFINSKKLNKCLCSACYQSLYRNSVVYPLPAPGMVTRSPDGKPICHICGRAFDAVLTHAYQSHGISEKEYKEQFGLDAGKGITSYKTYAKFYRSNKANYEVVVEQNLIQRGDKTRFEQGSSGRTKDKVRLQTLNRLKQQGFKKKS